jgi:hypothetical protein
MFTQLFRRLCITPAPASAHVTVVGQVFVHTHRGLTRLEAGTPVKVLDREELTNGTIRVHVADAEGRRGVCKETDIWEHVGQC